MKSFEIVLHISGKARLTVEAESKEEAIEEALNLIAEGRTEGMDLYFDDNATEVHNVVITSED